jgi:hypothetical protein
MYLLGTTLTNYLALLAALTTLGTGLPRIQCRCPDGRIMVFCQGSGSACCCGAARQSCSSELRSCCCKAKHRTYCQRTSGSPAHAIGLGHSQVVLEQPGCKKTLVADTAAFLVEDPRSFLQTVPVLLVWDRSLCPHSQGSGGTAAQSSLACLSGSSSLVIRFCHLTC